MGSGSGKNEQEELNLLRWLFVQGLVVFDLILIKKQSTC